MSLWMSSDNWSVVTHGLSEFNAAIVPSFRKPDDPPVLPWLPWDEQAPTASTNASAAPNAVNTARERLQQPPLIWPMRSTGIEFTDPAADHLGERRPEGVQYWPIVTQQDDCTIA
jgi:hypothetical protein